MGLFTQIMQSQKYIKIAYTFSEKFTGKIQNDNTELFSVKNICIVSKHLLDKLRRVAPTRYMYVKVPYPPVMPFNSIACKKKAD